MEAIWLSRGCRADCWTKSQKLRKNRKCLDGLPEEKRRSFLLSNVEGLKYKEVAELLNISEDKVDNNIRFVRKALQSSLKDYLPVILLTFISIK